MRKMRHKNWKTYLKIACSWLLIFSICFMNLETVSASEDETSVVTEQQRIAIARALVNKPAILLCDEPTGNLDPANSNEIMKILNQVNKQGTTVLVVTHNMEIVQQMKKRTITMSEGKIIGDQEKGGYFYED